MNPYVFKIGDFGITWYSVFILTGIIIAYICIRSEAKKFGIKSDFLTNLIFWTVIIGIIGARLYYVAFEWSYYSQHLDEILKVWEGGLAIHGGLLFGCLTIILYCKKNKVSPLRILDIISPYLLIAQGLGRWGNFFNSEAHGPVTTFAKLKAMKIPEFIIYGMNIGGSYYVPTFYYEFLWCILGAIIILVIRKLKYIRLGQQIGAYMMWYSIGRFFIESYRTDSLMLGYFKIAQIMSIVLFIAGFVLVLLQLRKPKLEYLYNIKEDKNVEIVDL